MILRSLGAREIAKRLRGEGLALRTGPFAVTVQSGFSSLAGELLRLYGAAPLLDADQFMDFRVAVQAPWLRRWWRPQALFRFDHRVPFRPLAAAHALPLLEWGLNWCVANHAHQYLIIHAAALERGGRVLLMPAPPGSGKSTLSAALVNRGWRLLSDELALIRPADGEVLGMGRPVSLKNRAIDVIATFAPSAVLSAPVTDTQKGTVALMAPSDDSVARALESAAPAWVVEPRYQPGAATVLEPRSRAETCVELARNSFNYSLLGVRGFETLGAVIDRCRCYRFEYSDLDQAVEAFAVLADER